MLSKQSISEAVAIYSSFEDLSLHTKDGTLIGTLLEELVNSLSVEKHLGEEGIEYALEHGGRHLVDYIYNHQLKPEGREDTVLEDMLNSYSEIMARKVSSLVEDIRTKIFPKVKELYKSLREVVEYKDSLYRSPSEHFFKNYTLNPVKIPSVLVDGGLKRLYDKHRVDKNVDFKNMEFFKTDTDFTASLNSAVTLYPELVEDGFVSVEDTTKVYENFMLVKCPPTPVDFVKLMYLAKSVIHYPHISTGMTSEENVATAKRLLNMLASEVFSGKVRRMIKELKTGRLVSDFDANIDLNRFSDFPLELCIYNENISKLPEGLDGTKLVLASTVTTNPKFNYKNINVLDLTNKDNSLEIKDLILELERYCEVSKISTKETEREYSFSAIREMFNGESERSVEFMSRFGEPELIGRLARDVISDSRNKNINNIDELIFNISKSIIFGLYNNSGIIYKVTETIEHDGTEDNGMINARIITRIITDHLMEQIFNAN